MKKLILLAIVLPVGICEAFWTGEFFKCIKSIPWAVGYFNRRYLR